MKWNLVEICALSLFFSPVFSQVDNTGSGRGLRFNGVNDYVEIDHSYPSLNLPFSVSAWVYVDPGFTGAGPIFVTNDNAPIYHGFWFAVGATFLQCEFGDGTGGDLSTFRRGKIVSISNVAGRWVHVSAVMKSTTDIDLYVNGINIGGGLSGNSNLTMASSYATDKAKIGYFLSNGVTYLFKGAMDEVRLWNRALSLDEVRGSMCKKLAGSEPGLVGYWDFNEIGGNVIFDKSTTGYNGQFIGNPTRQFSGAAIGDASVYAYPPPLTVPVLSLSEGIEKMNVSNVSGNPEGVHLYVVRDVPSQQGGLDLSKTNKPYFGVFLASLDANNTIDADLSFNNQVSCRAFQRTDNTVSSWNGVILPATNVAQRAEFLLNNSFTFTLDLGPDKILCDQPAYTISSGVDVSLYPLLWSTGEATSSITVNQSGLYTAKSADCPGIVDTVGVFFLTKPESANLGNDISQCIFLPRVLRPMADTANYQFTWQDGSHKGVYHANDFGTYWVKAKNFCGEVSDTITITPIHYDLSDTPNIITPNNGDETNQYFVVQNDMNSQLTVLVVNRWGKEAFRSDAYRNDWDGGDLAAGVYFVRIIGECVDFKGSLTIVR
jgi:hypothetical protein